MRLYFGLIFCLCFFTSWGQTLIFLEDFSSQPDGTQNDPGVWSTTFFDTDDGTINAGDNYWGVFAGEFRVNDIEGPAESCENYIVFDSININGFCDVFMSVDVRFTGMLECTGGPPSADWVICMYRIDGGAWDTFSTNGFFCGDAGLPGSARDTCNEGTWLEMQIQVGNKSNSETYFIDNVTVSGQNHSDFLDAGPDATICAGDGVQINATGAKTYDWVSNGNVTCDTCPDAFVTPTTTTLFVLDGFINSCADRDSLVITVITDVNSPLPDEDVVCDGGPKTLDAGPGFNSYSWSTGANTQTISITQAGTYTVTVTDNSCTGTASIDITDSGVPIPDLGDEILICGTPVVLDASNPASTYLWHDNSAVPSFTAQSTGTYWVAVTNACGTGSDTVDVVEGEPPTVNLGEDRTLCDDNTVTLDATGSPGTFQWQDNSTDSVLVVSTSGTYSVSVTNNCGTATDAVTINFVFCGDTTVPDTGCRMLLPTAFSPNDDGMNDKLRPRANCVLNDYEFRIFNRWGNRVFETTFPDQTWNGRRQGIELQVGTYIYYLRYTFEGYTEETQFGTVTLLR